MIKKSVSYFYTNIKLISNLVIILLVLLMGMYIRTRDLYDFDYSSDAIGIIQRIMSKNIDDVIKNVFRTETHPPLSHILTWLAYKINHDVYIYPRIFPIILGTLLIIFGYLFGKIIYSSNKIGIILMIIMSLSPNLIEQAQNNRSYTYLLFFLFCSFFCVYQYLITSKSYYLLGFGISTILSLLSDYSAFAYSLSSFITITFFNKKNNNNLLLWLAILASSFFIAIIIIIALTNNSNLLLNSALSDTKFPHLQYPTSIKEYLLNLYLILSRTTYSYQYGMSLYISTFILFLIHFMGIIFLLLYSPKEIKIILVNTIIITIILSLFRMFPLSASRHSLHLYPFLIASLGQILNYLFKFKHKKFQIIIISFLISYLLVSNKYLWNRDSVPHTSAGDFNGSFSKKFPLFIFLSSNLYKGDMLTSLTLNSESQGVFRANYEWRLRQLGFNCRQNGKDCDKYEILFKINNFLTPLKKPIITPHDQFSVWEISSKNPADIITNAKIKLENSCPVRITDDIERIWIVGIHDKVVKQRNWSKNLRDIIPDNLESSQFIGDNLYAISFYLPEVCIKHLDQSKHTELNIHTTSKSKK